MLSTDYFQQLLSFFEALLFGKASDSIFFGLFDSWESIALSIADIFVSAFCFYFILKLFKESRAWQLFKGALFLFAFALLCNFFGLKTISYLLYHSMSILIIGFVVIFQPELRKALETLGRNSFELLRTAAQDLSSSNKNNNASQMILALVEACRSMALSKTGALIIIEQRTGLKEIIDASSTAVILDSLLTAPALEQIFYKNSPLHDGALILRNGRIFAARCHVPLSETTKLKGNLGTRHRAALGASEMGDSLAIVVSEEKGHISLAKEGVLYKMKSTDELKNTLEHLLLDKGEETTKQKAGKLFSKLRSSENTFFSDILLSKDQRTSEEPFVKRFFSKLSLQLLSLLLAVLVFLFIQVSTNPIESYTLTNVNILKNNILLYEQQGYTVQLQNPQLSITVRARQNVIQRLKNQLDVLTASIELPTGNLIEGSYTLPIQIKSELLSDRMYQVQKQSVSTVVVTVVKPEEKENTLLPGIESNVQEIYKVEDAVSAQD